MCSARLAFSPSSRCTQRRCSVATRTQSRRKPSDHFARRAKAARRVGHGARCECGEMRAAALNAGSQPMTCQACKRTAGKQTPIDAHHVTGRANDPTTISIPTNDHVAELSERQRDWPELTLRNPDRDPLLRAAACVRGCFDTVVYLAQSLLLWTADLLEALSAHLTATRGRFYWRGTPLDAFAPVR
jgi:hypothetical protein